MACANEHIVNDTDYDDISCFSYLNHKDLAAFISLA